MIKLSKMAVVLVAPLLPLTITTICALSVYFLQQTTSVNKEFFAYYVIMLIVVICFSGTTFSVLFLATESRYKVIFVVCLMIFKILKFCFPNLEFEHCCFPSCFYFYWFFAFNLCIWQK